MQNQISAELTAATVTEVLSGIQDIKAKLPFLEGITPEDRRSAPKLGDKSRAFTARTLDLAESDDSFLPRSFNVAEFRRDFDLFQKLDRIESELARLRELVSDTRTLAGSDAYVAALDVYAAAKRHGKAEGLDGLTDLLSKRFGRRLKDQEEAEVEAS